MFPGLNGINIDFFQIQGASILGIPLIVTEQVGINEGQACDIDSVECRPSSGSALFAKN